MVARLALLSLAALALGGCHQEFHLGFGVDPSDPPVHGGQDIGANPGSVAASAGQAFTGRAVGELTGRMKIWQGFVKTKTSWARFVGTYESSLTDSAVGSGQWHARFKAVRNRATGKFTIKGLILADFGDSTAGRACLSLGLKGRRAQNRRPKKASRSTVTVLGGEGGARTLYGTARVRVRLLRSNEGVRLKGLVKEHRGAPRGFTPACTKLERKFGLAPLPATD